MNTKQRMSLVLPGAALYAVSSIATLWAVASLFMGESIFHEEVRVPLTVWVMSGFGMLVGSVVIAAMTMDSKERFPWNALCFSVFVVSVSTGIGFALV